MLIVLKPSYPLKSSCIQVLIMAPADKYVSYLNMYLILLKCRHNAKTMKAAILVCFTFEQAVAKTDIIYLYNLITKICLFATNWC